MRLLSSSTAYAVMRSLMSPASIAALVTPVHVTTVGDVGVQPVTVPKVVVVAGDAGDRDVARSRRRLVEVDVADLARRAGVAQQPVRQR